MERSRSSHDRVVRFALRIIEVLEERWNTITPAVTTIEGVIKPAVIEADTAIVLPSDQVLWVKRVGFNQLFSLPSVGAILVHPDIARRGEVAITAPKRIICNTNGIASGIAIERVGGRIKETTGIKW